MRLLRVQPDILESCPGTMIGVVVASGLDNNGAPAQVEALLRSAEADAAARLRGVELAEHPRIAPWRAAYRQFGAKPKKHICSVEGLLRRVLKGEKLPHINKLVDIYNAISLLHLLPVGGEDIDRVCGNVELAFAGDQEPAVRLLGEVEDRPPRRGEVIYRDRVGAVCRRWNWKEAERTKLTEETTRALLVIEALPPTERSELGTALSELVLQVSRHCGGETRTAIVEASSPQTAIGTESS